MTDREKLIEVISGSGILCEICGESTMSYCAEALADHLIANGVKAVGAETDLTGKCGSCAFAKPVRYSRSACYVRCTNEDLLKSRPNRGEASAIRARTNKGCKRHTPKED